MSKTKKTQESNELELGKELPKMTPKNNSKRKIIN